MIIAAQETGHNADMLRDAEHANEGVAIGSYPFFKDGRVGANFVVRSEDGRLSPAAAVLHVDQAAWMMPWGLSV